MMTQKSNKIETDELNILLDAAEHGMAGQLLRAGMEDLAPSPEFARELETRLLANAAPPAKPAQAKRARLVVVTGIQGRLKAPLGDKGIRAGRIRPLAMGALGIAAMVLLFVGMAAMINRRQQLNLNGQTPTSNVILTDTARLAKDFTLLYTLPLNLSMPQTRDIQMAWTPDGHTLIALTVQGALAWDGDTGKLKYIMAGQDADSMAISPDGHWLAVGWGGSGILLFDLHTGREGPYLMETAPLDAPFRGGLLSITWSPDSKYLASAANVPFSYSPRATEFPAPAPVPVIGDPVTSFSLEGIIHIWDATTGTEARTIKVPAGENGDNGWASKVAWSPVGNTLASISSVSTLRLWDMTTGKMLHTLEDKRKLDTAHIEWSPDGRTLAVVADRQVQLWDAASGRLIRSLPDTVPALPTPVPTVEARLDHRPALRPVQSSDYYAITSMIWSPDGNTFATSDGGHIRLWDPENGQVRLAVLSNPLWLAWSPDGKVLASGGWGDTTLRDAASGEQIRTIPFQQARYMAWSSTGDKLAMTVGVGQKGAPISIWGVPSTVEPTATVIAKQTVQLAVPSPETTSLSPTTTVISVPTVATSQPTGVPIPPTTPVATPSCGLAWRAVPSYSKGTLKSVAAISSNDVWAVGYTAASPAKTLVQHWDGKVWKIVPSPSFGVDDNILNGIVALSPKDIWAVGYYGNDKSRKTLTMHWDGTSWTTVASPDGGSALNELRGVAAVAPDDVWAVGASFTYCNTQPCKNKSQTLALHWNGKVWRMVSSPNPGAFGGSLKAVSSVSDTDVWAVGSYGDQVQYTGDTTAYEVSKLLFLHWDGKVWLPSPGPGANGASGQVMAVTAISSTDVWAVGSAWNGEPDVNYVSIHWDGNGWTENPEPREQGGTGGGWDSIVALTSNDIWVAGWNWPSRHWDGKEWGTTTRLQDPPWIEGRMLGMSAVAPDDIWAVGGLDFNMNGAPDKSAHTVHYSNIPCSAP